MDACIDSHRHRLRISLVLVIVIGFLSSCMEAQDHRLGSELVDHGSWTELLQSHVDSNGNVDYQGFVRDSSDLNQYLDKLGSSHPDVDKWTREDQLAFWINAYNAFTVKLIVDNYPVNSIKDLHGDLAIPFVNSIWDEVFISIQGINYSLNDIEHKILRKKFNEPRIHFAINCASRSCPVLRNEAFVAGNLEYQLKDQAIIFINDNSKNEIGPKSAKVSRIFQWFGSDFKSNGNLIHFLNLYSEIRIDDDASISYLDYDWSLNE